MVAEAFDRRFEAIVVIEGKLVRRASLAESLAIYPICL